MKINKVGIIGLGLIGGSLAKSLKANKICDNIVAYDINTESLEHAKKDGVINSFTNKIDNSFKDCKIIFLCMPVKLNIKCINLLLPFLDNDTILSDVGSTKNDIMKEINSINLPCTFIGGHPMTGSEKSGYDAAKNYLFENAYYILCYNNETNIDHIKLIQNLLFEIGALPLILKSDEHDYVTAAISHIPHIIASSLVHLVNNEDQNYDSFMHKLAAGGFKDLTRIASSSPDMWQNICINNKQNIVNLLDKYIHQLTIFKESLNKNENTLNYLYNYFDTAKKYRDSLPETNLSSLVKSYRFAIDVKDKPGIIAEISNILFKNHINIKNIGIVNNREHEKGILEISFYDSESKLKSISILRELDYTVY